MALLEQRARPSHGGRFKFPVSGVECRLASRRDWAGRASDARRARASPECASTRGIRALNGLASG